MTQQDFDKLDKAKLAEACQTALNCFRAIYDAFEDGDDAEDILEDAQYWPLSLLRHALGDESDKGEAEQNWRNGEYVGPA